jgi:hypothetical protein
MAKEPGHTSDGQERDNAEPQAGKPVAPTIPWDIDDNNRVVVLNELGTYANALNTYWAGTATPIGVLDISASLPVTNMTSRINDIINILAALVTEFPTNFGSIIPMKPYWSIDYNSFTSVISGITAQMAAMATAKP